MNIWDCHVHCYDGNDRAEDILPQMDQAGITRISLMGFHPTGLREASPPPTNEALRAAIDHLAGVQAADPDRIYGLFWADPRTPGILDLLEYALVDRGLRGVKLIPNHWAPCDEVMLPFYEKMQALGKPLHLHSGILYAFGDSSRFCRPVLYETMINYPHLKFALAHIGWPWVDECLAVFGHFRSIAHTRKLDCRMWIDTCRGTPDAWRLEALQKAVPFCGTSRLMYGTDCGSGSIGSTAPVHIRKDLDLLRSVMGLSEGQIEEFFWGAAERFYAPD